MRANDDSSARPKKELELELRERFTFFHTLFFVVVVDFTSFFRLQLTFSPITLEQQKKASNCASGPKVGSKTDKTPATWATAAAATARRPLWQRPRLVAFAGQ